MVPAWLLAACVVVVASSTARAACDDIDTYLSIPSPMTADTIIGLDDVDTIACQQFDEDNLDEVIVSGAYTLTLKSSTKVRFVDIAFTVEDGASLVFDMPDTDFGPNTEGFHRGNYRSFVVNVKAGGSASFLGNLYAKEVANVFSVLTNAGTMEFKKDAVFQDGGNAFRVNTGIVKFRGSAVFRNNRYQAVWNKAPGFIRFSKDVVFDRNSYNFDGAFGCSVTNDSGAKIVFRGETVIENNVCSEGVAMYNAGTARFYDKAYYNNNKHDSHGGAVSSSGSIKFRGAVQFNDNVSEDNFGGGIAVVNGGDVTFRRSVTFDGNEAGSGAAFAVLGEGSKLTFTKPSAVRFRNPLLTPNEFYDDGDCLIGFVDDDAILSGFPGEDVCSPADE